MRLRSRPRNRTFEDIVANSRSDFGDGTTVTAPKVFGDLELERVYQIAWDYEVEIPVRSTTGESLREIGRLQILPL